MRCFQHTLYLFFFFRGRVYFLIGWSLWSCLDCIQVIHFVLYLFSSCHFVFTLFGLFMLGGVYFVFLVSNFLLIYDYEFFIVICFYCVCLKSRFLFFSTCIFSTHAGMHFVLVFQEIYRLIQLSCCLLLQLMDSNQIEFVFLRIIL